MATLSRDTSPEAEAVMISILSALPACRRFEMLDDACGAAKALARVGLRTRHPEASEVEIGRLEMDLLLGEPLAEKVYGPRSR